MTRNFKYQVVEIHDTNGLDNAAWQIVDIRKNRVVSTHYDQGDALREVQSILADEANPNFVAAEG